MKLVLFDLDGTLTRKDTLIAFARFSSGNIRFSIALLIIAFPYLSALLGAYPIENVKGIFLNFILKGKTKQEIEYLGKEFARSHLPSLFYTSAIRCMENHIKAGNRVIIVTASFKEWIEACPTLKDVELITSEFIFENNQFKGKIINCKGPQKAKQIKNMVNLQDYDSVVAYGNSPGDKEMLALADEVHYRKFSS